MRKFFLIVLLVVILLTQIQKPVYASEKTAGRSAVLATNIDDSAITKQNDRRVYVLYKFLEKWNSPMKDEAENFVKYADEYDIDWKFVAAIAGLESQFGKQIPYNSYNAWGWGIYGTNVIRFSSWEEGIKTVSHGLRTRYMDSWGATDVYEIGPYYASSPTWAVRVDWFMNQIENFEPDPKPAIALSLSI